MFLPFILTLATPLSAQLLEGGGYVPNWESSIDWGGGHLTPMPDVNGDGIKDWLHSSYSASPIFVYQGVIGAWSGADGALLWEAYGSSYNARLGNQEPLVRELDGDGVPEVIAYTRGTSLSNDIHVFDCVTGSLKWSQLSPLDQERFAYSLWLADVTGDGNLEIFTTSQAESGSSSGDQFYCFAADGSLLWKSEEQGFYSEPLFQDLDSDGVNKVIVPNGNANSGGLTNNGSIKCLDGQTGTLIWQQSGIYLGQQLGQYIDFEDLDKNGSLDVIARCPTVFANGLTEIGGVWAFEGASGNQLWRVLGANQGDKLGEVYGSTDINADGTADLLLGMPNRNANDGAIQCLNGSDGSLLWHVDGPSGMGEGLGARLWTGDYIGSGGTEVLVESAIESHTYPWIQHKGWRLLNSADGTTHWALPIEDGFGYAPEVLPVDLDYDGQSEFLISSPTWSAPPGNNKRDAGVVYLIQTSGAILWRKEGPRYSYQYGETVLIGNLDGIGPEEIVVRAMLSGEVYNDEAGSIEALDGMTGTSLWSRHGQKSHELYGINPALAELKNDGSVDFIFFNPNARGWRGPFQGMFYCLDGESGEEIFIREGPKQTSHFPSGWGLGEDCDGDGVNDLVILGNESLQRITGSGNYQEFLSTSENQISISAGGEVDLNLDFTAAAPWYEYLILASAHGPGLNYEFGFPVPLTLDHWVFISADKKLPKATFQGFHGVLDKKGKAKAKLVFLPNQIPPSLLGNSATFAALAKIPWKRWKHCSVPKSVKITL